LEIENRAVGARNEIFEKNSICSKDAEAHLETFFCLQKLLQINTQEVTFHFVIFYVMYALTAAKAILRRKKASLTTKWRLSLSHLRPTIQKKGPIQVSRPKENVMGKLKDRENQKILFSRDPRNRLSQWKKYKMTSNPWKK
jgi:hypothetical protein